MGLVGPLSSLNVTTFDLLRLSVSVVILHICLGSPIVQNIYLFGRL